MTDPQSDEIKFYAECIRKGDDPETVLRTALTRQRADLVADIENSRPIRDENLYRQGIHAGIDRAIYRIQHPPVESRPTD